MDSLFQWMVAIQILSFLKTPFLIRGEYKIIHPESPVIGFLEEDVTLPCQVIATVIPGDITVQWQLIGAQENVHVSSYNRGNKEEKQDQRYQGRTEFFHLEMNTGNMSLKLKNIQTSDTGNYMCRVVSENWYDEALIELEVTARGGESFLFLENYADQGIILTCRSEGWFPEPQVLWLGSKGEKRTEKTNILTKTLAGRYSIASSINIQPGSDNEVSCKITNKVLNTTSESRVLISDVFFSTTSPWMAAFLVLLVLSIVVIAAISYKLKNNNDTTSRSEKERLLNALETNKRTYLLEIQVVQEKNDRLAAELDFRRAQSYAVPITLDLNCKHPELKLSEDQKRVWREPASTEPAAPSVVSLVVGKEGFAAGRQYWEVEVGDNVDWELGVLSQAVQETVKRQKAEKLPEEGYWSLRRSQGDFSINAENAKIEKGDGLQYTVIGVFLDREGGKISYYNVKWMFRFAEIPAEFNEKYMYYPFLSPGTNTGREKPLAIHPITAPIPLKPLRKEK